MSAPTEQRATLAVYPVAPYPQHGLNLEAWQDATNLLAAEGLDMAYGHCTWFCAIEDSGDGETVDAHGPFCESIAVGSVDGRDVHGEEFFILAGLVKQYVHGVYRHEDRSRNPDPLIRLTLLGSGIEDDEDEGKDVFLTVGEVRRMVAALTYAADQADQLDQPLFNRRPLRSEFKRDA